MQNQKTPLHDAKTAELAKALLDAKADANAKDRVTILMCATPGDYARWRRKATVCNA